MKTKPLISADHAINWYIGNYLLNPKNALRNEEIEVPDSWVEDINSLRVELKGREMTHKQFLDLVKERGIHEKYYRYKKYEPPYCAWCDKFHVPR